MLFLQLHHIDNLKTTGRNDPCPCGSGKKYKKCHGAEMAVNADVVYDRIRRLDAECSQILANFARQSYGESAAEEAWEEFFFDDDIPFQAEHPEMDFFERWFLSDWRPEGTEKLPELLLSLKGSKVAADIRRFIEATLRAPYSFYQTIDVSPGNGLTLRDILRNQQVAVKEKSASTILDQGHIVLAKVVEMDGVSFMMGCGSFVIPPGYIDPVLKLRTLLERDTQLIDGCVTAETLFAFDDTLRGSYFKIAETLTKKRKDIRNSDGDPILLHTLTYSIPSLDRAFHALKDLEQSITGGDDAQLLEASVRNGDGDSKKILIHWMKGKKDSGGGNIVLGMLTLSDTTLIAEVNSEKRSRRIQKEITKRLGDFAVLLRSEVQTLEGAMKQAKETRNDHPGEIESEHDRLMRESPEARAAVAKFMENHWSSWPGIPLPALRGMTPRQAARDPIGRELLESVLLDFEANNRNLKEEHMRVDIAHLRRELGVEKE